MQEREADDPELTPSRPAGGMSEVSDPDNTYLPEMIPDDTADLVPGEEPSGDAKPDAFPKQAD
jgi:hypothetical protein